MLPHWCAKYLFLLRFVILYSILIILISYIQGTYGSFLKMKTYLRVLLVLGL